MKYLLLPFQLLTSLYEFIEIWLTVMIKKLFGLDIYVSKDVQKDRLRVCGGCQYYVVDADFCKDCFCKMKVKTSLKDSECRMGKWGKE